MAKKKNWIEQAVQESEEVAKAHEQRKTDELCRREAHRDNIFLAVMYVLVALLSIRIVLDVVEYAVDKHNINNTVEFPQ